MEKIITIVKVKKIFSLEDKKHIVTVPNECRNFSVSEKYVYCAVADGVLQYGKEGIDLSTGKISHKVIKDKEQVLAVSDNYYSTFYISKNSSISTKIKKFFRIF